MADSVTLFHGECLIQKGLFESQVTPHGPNFPSLYTAHIYEVRPDVTDKNIYNV